MTQIQAPGHVWELYAEACLTGQASDGRRLAAGLVTQRKPRRRLAIRAAAAVLLAAASLASCTPAGPRMPVPPTGQRAGYHWPAAPQGCRWEWAWDGRHWSAGHWAEICQLAPIYV